eukprot:maker-scaffold680_size113040-snap-gene-0.22 protein:Tk03794 transcript:maker-scaffold680_size113040-snap-gene-0.22-mRNA-1 annotation:"hypothetical protein EIN_169060"
MRSRVNEVFWAAVGIILLSVSVSGLANKHVAGKDYEDYSDLGLDDMASMSGSRVLWNGPSWPRASSEAEPFIDVPVKRESNFRNKYWLWLLKNGLRRVPPTTGN